jgi:two-component system alkaline phosphatase synthesis response regulator PhoP
MKKTLIVEDHPDMLKVLTSEMEMMGFSVIGAKDGKEGVEKAIKEKPNLILMDIMMPFMDGRDATRLIRSNPETQDIPILVATARANNSLLESCIEAGSNDYILKPFTFKELQKKVQDFVPSA